MKLDILIGLNGFGYDNDAELEAKLAEDLMALSLKIRVGKASPGYFELKSVPGII